MFTRVLRAIVGPARSPLDPKVQHQISLIAFLAWVGIGADGLSSSCYGPEQAFNALGEHRSLAVFLALATALTVAVISAGYSYVIEAFPSGGGGYVVATKRLGAAPGLIAGGALLVDYVLTISISIASGVDQIFSFLPQQWHGLDVHSLKLPLAALAIVCLVMLNLRGVKESVLVLMPIFLVFLVTHVVAIATVTTVHADGVPAVVRGAWGDASHMVGTVGAGATLLLFLKAYSLGAGTYTGVEAVSNSMQVLREPRVETGKRTMIYLAASLAFVSAGILAGYLLLNVRPVEGKVLNAVLLEGVTAGWGTFGWVFVRVALLSAAALLFVAAQAGFIGGPRMLATMAVDRWMPQRFARLSDRLVVQDGVLLMGVGALLFLIATGGSVVVLVVMYSINVFITFVLSQLGMVRHWWSVRAQTPRWGRRLFVNAAAFVLCAVILAVMVWIKGIEEAREGHWGAALTMLITAGVCMVAWGIRRHYNRVARTLRDLDVLLTHDLTGGAAPPAQPLVPDPKSPTAVLMVSGYNGVGMHTLLSVLRLFPWYFRNLAFVMVGVVDFDRFKGKDEVDNLKRSVDEQLGKYADQARRMGFPVETYSALGLDPVHELERLCPEIARSHARAVFFGGQLVFPEENILTRQLHSGAVFEIQRRLHFLGLPMMVLPVRVQRKPASAPSGAGGRPSAGVTSDEKKC